MAKATRYPAAEVVETGRTVRGLVEVRLVPQETAAEREQEAALMDALAGLRPTRPVVFRPWQRPVGRGRR